MLILIVASKFGATGCFTNKCDFYFQRCNGNVMEQCGGGVDQMFHRDIISTDCRNQDRVCVETSSSYAACVSEPVTPCEPREFKAYCEGNTAVYCEFGSGHVQRRECTVGTTCVVDQSRNAPRCEGP